MRSDDQALLGSNVGLQIAALLSFAFVAACIGWAVASPSFGCDSHFNDQHHFLQAWISGGASGALLLLSMTAVTSRRMLRDACTWYCILILLNSAVRFLVAGIGREELVCVVPLGGMRNRAPRGVSVLTLLYWGTTAPTTLALLATLSGSGKRSVSALCWTAVCLITGSAGTLSGRPVPWIVLHLVSFCTEGVVLYYLVSFARLGMARAQDRLARALWQALLPLIFGAWVVIPVMWLLGQLDVLSFSNETDVLGVMDFLVKLAFVTLNVGELCACPLSCAGCQSRCPCCYSSC